MDAIHSKLRIHSGGNFETEIKSLSFRIYNEIQQYAGDRMPRRSAGLSEVGQVEIVKAVNSLTPLIFKWATTHTELEDVSIEFDTDHEGRYGLRIEMEKAIIATVALDAMKDGTSIEHVTFAFDSITWRYVTESDSTKAKYSFKTGKTV